MPGERQVCSNCSRTPINPFGYQDAVKGRRGELALSVREADLPAGGAVGLPQHVPVGQPRLD